MISSVVAYPLAVTLAVFLWYRWRYACLPPSYKSRNSTDAPWRAYAACIEAAGPLLTVAKFPRPIIVVNTVAAATELLEKRVNFACRPRWPMAELLGRQKNVGFQYYGPRLKQSRRALHSSLNASVVGRLWDVLMNEQSMRMLDCFVIHPDTFFGTVQGTIEELIFRLTYGTIPDEEYLKVSKIVMHETGIALQPGRWVVNQIPLLAHLPNWLPGFQFKRWAQVAREKFFDLTRAPFQEVKKNMVHGIAEPSFVRYALEGSQGTAEEDDIIMCAAGSLYSAGTDTLSGTLLTALLLLTHHPEVQHRAHAEIIQVVGPDRLPELHDADQLHYLDCVIQEVHRYNPAIPLVTHSNMAEDSYGGYKIPKKTWVLGNVWAMLHDEIEYPDPESFKPERFMPQTGLLTPRDPRTLIYGFGRRICPGLHLANRFLYLCIARIIATFEVLPPTINGELSLPPLDFIAALVPAPKHFRCVLKPREGCERHYRP